jgi:ATP-dependent HslUV protease subunit HslV
MNPNATWYATTILCVRKDGGVAIGGDGQVTVGDTVMKSQASKVRRLADGKVLAGFAGAAADAFTLFEKFEEKMERFPGNLSRNADHSYVISGSGELIEPDDGVLAIGSGGNYALAAARALLPDSALSARDIVERGLAIAADICVFTNSHITILELD